MTFQELKNATLLEAGFTAFWGHGYDWGKQDVNAYRRIYVTSAAMDRARSDLRSKGYGND
jgi:hypothetical protein